eukprot:10938658-Alexandrium_andersonii.AAC.1
MTRDRSRPCETAQGSGWRANSLPHRRRPGLRRRAVSRGPAARRGRPAAGAHPRHPRVRPDAA